LLALVLVGCTGPAYHVPDAPVPRAAAYREAWKVAAPQDALGRGKWWTVFREPELDALEARLNVDNQTIKQAFETYLAACAQIRQARAAYFPTVTTIPSATVSRSSGTTSGVVTPTTAGGPVATPGAMGGQRFTSYALPLDASWAPDLFGRVRYAVQQAQFGAQVSAGDLESQRLLQQATLAMTYFQLRGQDALKRLLASTVEADTRVLELTRNLFTTGIGTEVAVVQAEQTLQTARVQAINVGLLRAQYEHAIATLLGVPATAFTIPERPTLAPPPAIPTGVPSQLLERRPDIAAAERQMAASNAQIGVGYAAYCPTLTLTGSAGLVSSALGTLISWPSRIWSLGGQLAQPLFEGGLRRATIDQYKATYEANVASYRQVVLTAFQQVEDALSALRILEEEVAAQKHNVQLAEKAFGLEKVRFETGIDPYLNLMTQQTVLLSAQQTLVSLEVQALTWTVSLVQALGGGWERSQLPTPGDATGQRQPTR
jgi:NodT family efflux transporter outer membrane factor (OMF) lipoprotein